MDLAELRAESEALARARALAALPVLAGLSSHADLRAAYADHRAAWEPEAFGLAHGPATGAGEPARKDRARRLAAFVASSVEGGRAARHDEKLLAAWGGEVRLASETLTFAEALARIPEEPSPEKRREQQRAVMEALGAARAPLEGRIEAGVLAARDLGFADYASGFAALEGFDPRTLADEAARLLDDTEAAWQDVLAWALRSVEGAPRPLPGGDAAWHDLLRLFRLPRLDRDFTPGAGWKVFSTWAETLGLDPLAEGSIERDFVPRPARAVGARVVPIEVPGRVALLWRPAAGARAHLALYGAAASALHRALTAPEAPFEDRWGGDDSVDEAVQALFRAAPLDPAWRKRLCGAPLDQDATRLLALLELAGLREAAARLAGDLELYALGPTGAVIARYRERLERALSARYPNEAWMLGFAPRLAPARALRGAALAAAMLPALRERFDADWWRNPAFGAWFSRMLAVGQRDAVEEVARRAARLKEAPPVPLAAAAAWLVHLLAI